MRDSGDVSSQAVERHGADLADVLEVSKSRCYEILSTDNPYPKAKRLIRAIAQVNPEGVWLIKADMDALFLDLLEAAGEVTVAEMHKESSEAVQSVLEGKTASEQKRELREGIASMQRRLNDIDREENGFCAKRAVADFRKKRAVH